MKKFIPFFATIGLVFLLIQACNEDELLDLTNPNELSSETFYQTGSQALSAVNIVYNSFQSRDLYRRRYFFAHDLLSGEATGLGSLAGDMVQLEQRTFDASNAAIDQLWKGCYRGIHRANLVLANVPNTETDITEADRQRYLGEAYFLRAWFYFELTSVFGAVPLLIEPANENVIEGLGRTSADQVYSQIFADLDFAEQNLPLKSEYADADAGRATKGAAQALKGKVALFRADYNKAIAELEKVINSGEYSLVENYTDNFTEEGENNSESIFEIQFGGNVGGQWSFDASGNGDVTFRGQEYGFNAWRNVIPSQRLQDEFEADDPRFGFTFYCPCDEFNNGENVLFTPNSCPPADGENPITPDDFCSWRKYQRYYRSANEDTNSPINFNYLRYSDVLLMLAEAKAEEGQIGEALELTNQVRQRPSVNMPPYPTDAFPFGTTAEALDAIFHERIVELSGEQVLYKDLLRRSESYYADWVPQAQLPKHSLLPIPQSEIDNNKNISEADQNPGY